MVGSLVSTAPRARASQLLPVASRVSLVASATPLVLNAKDVFVTTVQSFRPTPGLLGLPGRTLPTAKIPWVPYSKLLVNTRTGGKLEAAKGAGANLIGTEERLVFSVKCMRPLKVLVKRPE